MDFKSQYDAHERVHCPTGQPDHILYGLEYDKDGNLDLVKKGSEDLYEYIQSHADSVDINVILARYANGDASALEKYSTFYGDITDAPKSFADVLNKVIKAEDLFNTLPLEEREKFNFNVANFINLIGTEQFNAAVGTFPAVEEEEVKDEPKSE